MGLFSKKELPAPFQIIFGANFSESIARAHQANAKSLNIEFPQELMMEIDDAIGLHKASENVLYDEEMQFLNVVGESQHQDDLLEILKSDQADSEKFGLEREGSDWYAGFLMPEPYNPFDQNAVKVLMIFHDQEADDYPMIEVGYLAREQAKKVHKKVLMHLDAGKIIPVLLKITGGTDEKPNVGVLARAKTKAIKF